MKIIFFVISLLFFISTPLRAEGPPLIVGVDAFAPPFIIQAANSQFYGFDISMIANLCKRMNRTCQYKPLPFSKLLDAVAANQVDLAVGSIIITPERQALVNFSQPYLLSESRFLGGKSLTYDTLNMAFLNSKKIGVEKGTVFPDILTAMGVKPTQIVFYNKLDDIIEAIHTGEIDLALMDAPSAIYWQSQASGSLVALGKSFNFGFGLGIAVNRNDIALLQEINSALVGYQNSVEFKQNYQKYIASF